MAIDNGSNQQEVFTTNEAQEFLRLSDVTLWQLRRAGKIAFSRVGNKILYTRRDLEAFLNSTRQETKHYEIT